jgi:fructose-specific phosphotransferase system IIA component
MKVSDYLKEDFCIMNLKADKKEAAIIEIAERLKLSGNILDKEQFIKDVLERESLGSTGIGYNVAIPHARTKAVKGFVIGFGKSESGIEFLAYDNQKVNLIFLMGAHFQDLNLYLRLLAELSKLIMDSSFREELLSAKEAREVVEVIRKFEGK